MKKQLFAYNLKHDGLLHLIKDDEKKKVHQVLEEQGFYQDFSRTVRGYFYEQMKGYTNHDFGGIITFLTWPNSYSGNDPNWARVVALGSDKLLPLLEKLAEVYMGIGYKVILETEEKIHHTMQVEIGFIC